MQVWSEPVVAVPQRVASAAGIVERDLAVVRPVASAGSLLAEDIGTERDQGGKRQRELAKGHAALPYEENILERSTNQGAARSGSSRGRRELRITTERGALRPLIRAHAGGAGGTAGRRLKTARLLGLDMPSSIAV